MFDPVAGPAALVIIGLVTAAIGVSVGASGLGGFLIPALLVAVLHLDPLTAVGHGLISFLVPGVIGAVSYGRRHDRPPGRLVLMLCAGTVPGLLLGRWVAATASTTALQVLLAGIVLAAGVLMLVSGGGDGGRATEPRAVGPAALGAGTVGGLSTVLAGVGGPLVTVPVLSAVGLAITPVVGAAMINSVFGVAIGAISLFGAITVDPLLLVIITGAQLIGVPIGVRLHDRLARRWLSPAVAVVAMLTAGWLLLRVLLR